MLDLDLDLEADLGVDTVKQAELFASVREKWGIPRDEKRKLRDYPTLRHVIDVRAPDAAGPRGRPRSRPRLPRRARRRRRGVRDADRSARRTARRIPCATAILALVTEKTGYPPDMLDLDLDLEADLGVDTVKQAELFASVRETWGIPRDEKRKLRDYPTLRHVIDVRPPDAARPRGAPKPAPRPSSPRRARRGAGAAGRPRRLRPRRPRRRRPRAAARGRARRAPSALAVQAHRRHAWGRRAACW